ncbi:MAG TPA: hypothetical protein EYN67_08560 [Flavobacteriales bacterium]|nr:hypothetical protein [Flavobacteriales bacterium]
MDSLFAQLAVIGVTLSALCISSASSEVALYKNSEEIIVDVLPSGWVVIEKEVAQVPWRIIGVKNIPGHSVRNLLSWVVSQ